MKIRVTKSKDNHWYRVGGEYEVADKPVHRNGEDYYPLVDDYNVGVGVGDFEVISEEQPSFPFKVKCVDTEFSDGLLEFGKTYTATGEYMGTDYVLQDSYGTWSKDRFEVVKEPVQQKQEEYTGGSVSYYSVPINHPTDSEKDPYVAECNDVVEALDMNYAEGNAFKAIWRSCAARKFGAAKKGYDDGLYDAEKVVFFGQRMVERAKKK